MQVSAATNARPMGKTADDAPPPPVLGSIARGRSNQRMMLMPLEQHRRVLGITAPEGATPEDLRRPEFYRLIAQKVYRDDIIRILAFDGSWEAEIIIDTAFESRAEVTIWKVGSRQPVKSNSTVLGDGAARTEYRGGTWSVIRISDGVELISGHATEGAAIGDWMRSQPRRVA